MAASSGTRLPKTAAPGGGLCDYAAVRSECTSALEYYCTSKYMTGSRRVQILRTAGLGGGRGYSYELDWYSIEYCTVRRTRYTLRLHITVCSAWRPPRPWVQAPRPRRCCLTWTTCLRSRPVRGSSRPLRPPAGGARVPPPPPPPPSTRVALDAVSRRAAADATERNFARAAADGRPAGRLARPPPPPGVGTSAAASRWLSPRVGVGHRPGVPSVLPRACATCVACGATAAR